jgi:hypothetical protein
MNVMTLKELQDAVESRTIKHDVAGKIIASQLLIAKIIRGIPEDQYIAIEDQENLIDNSIPFIRGYNEWIESRKRLAQNQADEAHDMSDLASQIEWKQIDKGGQEYMYFIDRDNYYIFIPSQDGNRAINVMDNDQWFEMDQFPDTYEKITQIIRRSWNDKITPAGPYWVSHLGLLELGANDDSGADYNPDDEARAHEIAERDPFDPAGHQDLTETQRSLYFYLQQYLQDNAKAPETIFNVMSYAELQEELKNNRITQEELDEILNLRLDIGMKLKGVTQLPDDNDEQIKYINTSIPFLEEYNKWIESQKNLARQRSSVAVTAALRASAPGHRSSAAAAAAMRASAPVTIAAKDPIIVEDTDLDNPNASIKWKIFDDPMTKDNAIFSEDNLIFSDLDILLIASFIVLSEILGNIITNDLDKIASINLDK